MTNSGMAGALAQARLAASKDEIPIGAVVMRGDELVAEAHNETVARRNPTAHAEMLAIERALEALHTDRLTDCTLYVTIEPCAQCAGAIVLAKVGKLVFGAYDEKAGMCGSVGDLVRHPRLNHRVEVIGGVEAGAGAALVRDFFAARRGLGHSEKSGGRSSRSAQKWSDVRRIDSLLRRAYGRLVAEHPAGVWDAGDCQAVEKILRTIRRRAHERARGVVQSGGRNLPQ